jgi:hypothetical protein
MTHLEDEIPEVVLAEELCCLEWPECTCGLNENCEPIRAEDIARGATA